ncbi:hypothetical protein [Celeribacter indicus]|uniref:Uncharacterized protein n=1 Tax=Celeribacter indicus TaxID=1208324 RepID=A0A0B5DYD7_9RHOB|nr:hypothetical protein [Celeribacter indicus]AJE48024.1 hypothetical protein P73_3309 [Celeribacter indicus]SDW29795.1 hypothetical protein SAMN05443573_102302 [Celeribacter indicus]
MRSTTLTFGLLGVAGLAAAAAVASPYVPLTEDHLHPEPIVIEVPQEDLSRCIATLEQVFIGPVVDATVQSAALDPAERGPTVTCVAK